ncbi:MAG: hypothetical protein B7Z73_13460, partial [Planctomycetia bacterium 21-64-5]
MNPYLEDPGVWPDFHSEFISCLRHQLRQRLPRGYHARINERTLLFDMTGDFGQSRETYVQIYHRPERSLVGI